MSFSQQLIADMKQVMKDGDKVKLGVVRFLRSEIKNFEIDHGEQDDAGIEKITPGNRVGDISSAIQTLVEKHNYYVPRSYTGHGVGRQMHEAPQVPNFGRAGRGLVLRPGITIAIEPMVLIGTYHTQVLFDQWTVLQSQPVEIVKFPVKRGEVEAPLDLIVLVFPPHLFSQYGLENIHPVGRLDQGRVGVCQPDPGGGQVELGGRPLLIFCIGGLEGIIHMYDGGPPDLHGLPGQQELVEEVLDPEGNRSLRFPEEDLRVPVIEERGLDPGQELAPFIEVLLQGQAGPIVIMEVER